MCCHMPVVCTCKVFTWCQSACRIPIPVHANGLGHFDKERKRKETHSWKIWQFTWRLVGACQFLSAFPLSCLASSSSGPTALYQGDRVSGGSGDESLGHICLRQCEDCNSWSAGDSDDKAGSARRSALNMCIYTPACVCSCEHFYVGICVSVHVILTLSVPRKLGCYCRSCAMEFSGKMDVNSKDFLVTRLFI